MQTYDKINKNYNGMYQNQEYQGGMHDQMY